VAAAPSWIRSLLLLGALAVCALQTPGSWGVLWLLVPVAVAVSLLASWRYGMRGVLVPLALAVTALAVAGPGGLWAWWIPAAALTGAWMGLREEGGSAAGDRAWMLLPSLLLAAGLPWVAHYPELLRGVERELRAGDAEFVVLMQRMGTAGDRLSALRNMLAEQDRLRSLALPHVLPTVLFVWVAILVAAGRAVSARVSASLRWPALSRARLVAWRLPDGALWLLLAGLGLLVAGWPLWKPTAWTLVLNTALGFGVQGIAVVRSLLLARGVPPSIVVVSLLFVFAVAWPVFVLTAVAVGVSDVWLDFRRLEPTPEGDEQ
jgi:hypothetical protein